MWKILRFETERRSQTKSGWREISLHPLSFPCHCSLTAFGLMMRGAAVVVTAIFAIAVTVLIAIVMVVVSIIVTVIFATMTVANGSVVL